MIHVHLKPVPTQRKNAKTTKVAMCDAAIPLIHVSLSSGSVKRLAKNIGVVDLEALHKTPKDIIEDHIKNKELRKEIFAFKFQIDRIVKSSKHRNILLFEEKAKGKSIKIKSSQRSKLIGVALFSQLLKDIEETLVFVLKLNEEGGAFRERAVLRQIKDCSTKTILRA